MEPATAAAATPAAPSAPAATSPAPTSAGAALTSVPAGPDWASSFKNEEVKSYVSQKGFKTTEDLATSFFNLEKMKGVPEDRLLKLPEKLEGDDVRPIFERLGAPKEAKGYELPRGENIDPQFTEWAEGMFHKNNLTKSQAQGVLSSYNDYAQNLAKAQNEQRVLAIKHADTNLKKEWGNSYETNINIAKQGVKILGLDGKTLDLIESSMGRESLFKTLQKIGVSVGESQFVAGSEPGQQVATTPEQAQSEIKALMSDKKFGKKLTNGDVDANARWLKLHEIASGTGTKQIG